jgi:uridine kinase
MRPVIGIAGAPGSGKTSVTRALARELGDACTIHMDHYEHMTGRSMEELAAWAARGADYDELPVPLLREHLVALKAGEGVVEPSSGLAIAPARFILFETQFGRAHAGTGPQIDLLVWLDTPAEVALARRLRQLARDALAAPATELRPRIEWLAGFLDNYLALVQRLVAHQRQRVLPGADLVVEGEGDPAQIAGKLREEIVARFGAGA